MINKKKFINLIIIFLVLAGLLFVNFSPAQASTCTKYHTVKKGEYLVKIGGNYGVSWRYLAEINNIKSPYKIYPGQTLCVAMGQSSSTKPSGAIPTFTITTVQRNTSVTIQTHNFPSNDIFQVLMGAYGTQAVNGIKVQKWESGAGGTRSATFPIPSALKGSYRIAIRLQSTTGSGYFAYNWFYNNTAGGSGTGSGDAGDGTVKPGYTGIPTFSIAAVTRNTNVTIKTHNFPPGLTFDVLMGPMGTRGVNGIKVGTLNSGAGGTMAATFPIPAALQGSYRIAIRAQNSATGYYSYNWFYNNTTN